MRSQDRIKNATELHPPSRGLGPEPLVTVQELAVYLDVPVKTIYAWRHRNTGPRGIKVGRHLRFRWVDVDMWLAELAADDGH